VYNKLFTKILDSSIWLEPDSTRIVWVTCIAAMDEDGFVQMATVENLAKRANVSFKTCQKAVASLESPDKGSSDPDNDGRRLERVQGGWMVLNAQKYRELVTREVAKAQTRERVKRFREKKKPPVTESNGELRNTNAPVTPSEAVSEAETRSAAAAKQPSAATMRPAFKERPLSGYQRLRLFRWMVEDMIGVLGNHLEAFDLDAWLQAIDEDGSRVIPETWPWLREQLVAECDRRGLLQTPVSVARSAYEAWKAAGGCAHTPRCGNFTTCQLVSQRVSG